MRLIYAFLVCAILSGCGLEAQQPPTATATFSPTDTPTPNLTVTHQANRAATQTKAVEISHAVLTKVAIPTFTAIAKAAIMFDEIRNATDEIGDIDLEGAILNLGPRDGEIKDKADDFVGLYETELSLANFVVSIKFINPYDTAVVGKWDYGLFFRDQTDGQYRLAILSNQSWTLLRRDGAASTYIYSSNDKNLTTKEEEENTIWLIVIDKKAHLFINGIYAQSMDLGDGPSQGGLFPATGMYYGNDNRTGSTHFRDFTVWQLP